MKSFIRFAVLSGGGWLLDCVLLLVLAGLGIELGVSNFVSSMTAGVAVFLVSRRWIFNSSETPVLGSTLIYMAYQVLVIIFISFLIGPVATSAREGLEASGFFPGAVFTSFLGKVLLTPPQLLSNFLVSRLIVKY